MHIAHRLIIVIVVVATATVKYSHSDNCPRAMAAAVELHKLLGAQGMKTSLGVSCSNNVVFISCNLSSNALYRSSNSTQCCSNTIEGSARRSSTVADCTGRSIAV
jgi:hypothetical protein